MFIKGGGIIIACTVKDRMIIVEKFGLWIVERFVYVMSLLI